MAPDVPRLHEFGNVLRHVHLLHGNPATAPVDVWVEGYYETAMQDQAARREAGLAVPAEDGGVDIYVTTQWLHVDREQIAPCLGLPEDKVRLHLAGVGGAFGSRGHPHADPCLRACNANRQAGQVLLRARGVLPWARPPAPLADLDRVTALRGDGRLVTVDARLLFDGGAYASSSPAVVGNAVTFAAGPYEVPNVHVEGTVVYTNNPPCGAMRGFGAPQVCFAHEAQMDKLARRSALARWSCGCAMRYPGGSVLPTGQVAPRQRPGDGDHRAARRDPIARPRAT